MNTSMPIKTITIIPSEIERLYTKVNDYHDYKINVNSIELLHKIIQIWFDEQGYDFWNNPYPEVDTMQFIPNEGLTFTYEEA